MEQWHRRKCRLTLNFETIFGTITTNIKNGILTADDFDGDPSETSGGSNCGGCLRKHFQYLLEAQVF